MLLRRQGIVVLCSLFWMARLMAAPPPVVVPTGPDAFNQPGGTQGPFGFLDSRSSYLFGDMGGLRTLLSKYGVSLALQETSEELGNVSGGDAKGFEYDGLTQAVLQLDSQRAFGLYGGTFNVSGLQVHGSNLSADNLLTLQTASGIEADRSTRLWEVWYQQKLLEEDRLDVKVGQQSLDQEFMVSQDALVFVNTMFGWPMLPSADMPGGGPAYPLSALGVRFRARPWDSWTFLVGVFNGSPTPKNSSGDPQRSDASGTNFPLDGGTLVVAELQYAYPSLGTMLYANQSEPLARVYKLGFWYNSESFADEEIDSSGLSLANPSSTRTPLMHHGDYAFYAVLDQMVWQDPAELDRTVSVFLRPMWTPLADRNVIDFSTNAGFAFHEPFMHRDDDTFAVGLGYAHVSSRASALDRDTAEFTDTSTPIRNAETFFEVTYQYQVRPGWQIQPDIQYVFNPGAGVANPANPAQKVKNEAVFGLRTNIQF
jgi:porin